MFDYAICTRYPDDSAARLSFGVQQEYICGVLAGRDWPEKETHEVAELGRSSVVVLSYALHAQHTDSM